MKYLRIVVYGFVLMIITVTGMSLHADRSVESLVTKYTYDSSRFMQVDGMDVHYRDEGHGPVVILLHGSNASLHTWDGWVKQLKAHYRVISLDLPGHGLTGPHPQNLYKWHEVAAFLSHFVKALNISTFNLAGNSMGGAIAWHYAVMFPEQVEKLILLNSRGIPSEEPMPFVFRAYTVPVVNQLFTVMTPWSLVRASMQDLYGDDSKINDTMTDLYFDLTLREGNRDATLYRMTHLNTHEYLSKLKEINIPVFIMWGEKDQWILPKYAHQFHQRVPHSTLKIYPGAGHLPMEEIAGITATDALHFLQSTADAQVFVEPPNT